MEPLKKEPALWPPRYRAEWLGIVLVVLYVLGALDLIGPRDDWRNGIIFTVGFLLLYTIGTTENRPRKD